MQQNKEKKIYETYQECMIELLKLNNQIKNLTLKEIEGCKSVLLSSINMLEQQTKKLEIDTKTIINNLESLKNNQK